MATNILAKYAALNAMEVKELLVEWNKYFDRPPSSHNNKTYPAYDLRHCKPDIDNHGHRKFSIRHIARCLMMIVSVVIMAVVITHFRILGLKVTWRLEGKLF